MIYVIIQFGFLFFIGYFANWSNIRIVSGILIGLSVFLGLWAIFTVGINKVRILPDIKKDMQLVKKGPYNIIRHPMYSAVILLCGGLVLSNTAWYMYLGFTILIFDLLFKLRYEEKKLLIAFPEYEKYKNGTFYLIPFIY